MVPRPRPPPARRGACGASAGSARPDAPAGGSAATRAALPPGARAAPPPGARAALPPGARAALPSGAPVASPAARTSSSTARTGPSSSRTPSPTPRPASGWHRAPKRMAHWQALWEPPGRRCWRPPAAQLRSMRVCGCCEVSAGPPPPAGRQRWLPPPARLHSMRVCGGWEVSVGPAPASSRRPLPSRRLPPPASSWQGSPPSRPPPAPAGQDLPPSRPLPPASSSWRR
mmetsp:Transcript_8386/g.23292  ORF Transcript_8386/g.23292 Transcript_8386/m.23292 type:complete len:229 (+) Transcript_8386:88-774(+)